MFHRYLSCILVAFLCIVGIVAYIYQTTMTLPSPQAQVLKSETLSVKKTTIFNKGSHLLGLYDWRNPVTLSDKDIAAFFQKIHADGIDTIYLTVDTYIDILEMPDGDKKTEELSKYEESLKKYIAMASRNEIKVHALAGDKTWAESDYDYLPPLTIHTVIAFNKKVFATERFTGIQFDIESYNLSAFADNQTIVLMNYLAMVEKAVRQVKGNTSPLALGFALPYWFDGENGNLEKIAWKGKTDFPFYHVADLLNTYDASYISLMSYRNIPSGDNGTIAISFNEIKYTTTTAPNVYVIIAQETTNVEPAKITFYGQPASQFYSAVNTIYTSFKGYKSFGGVAIHDAIGYSLINRN